MRKEAREFEDLRHDRWGTLDPHYERLLEGYRKYPHRLHPQILYNLPTTKALIDSPASFAVTEEDFHKNRDKILAESEEFDTKIVEKFARTIPKGLQADTPLKTLQRATSVWKVKRWGSDGSESTFLNSFS